MYVCDQQINRWTIIDLLPSTPCTATPMDHNSNYRSRNQTGHEKGHDIFKYYVDPYVEEIEFML